MSHSITRCHSSHQLLYYLPHFLLFFFLFFPSAPPNWISSPYCDLSPVLCLIIMNSNYHKIIAVHKFRKCKKKKRKRLLSRSEKTSQSRVARVMKRFDYYLGRLNRTEPGTGNAGMNNSRSSVGKLSIRRRRKNHNRQSFTVEWVETCGHTKQKTSSIFNHAIVPSFGTRKLFLSVVGFLLFK